MANREPRWNADETCETGWSVANLLKEHAGDLTGALADLGGPAGVSSTLDEKADQIRELSVKIQSGEVEPTPNPELVTAITEVPLIVRAVREMVKRLHRDDISIRGAFGIGTIVNVASTKSLLRAISLVNSGAKLYPELAERFPPELLQAAATHEATLLLARVGKLPSANEPNPDIAARNALQVEVQNLVDCVLADVAIHCWRTPETPARFKAALPSTRPPKQ